MHTPDLITKELRIDPKILEILILIVLEEHKDAHDLKSITKYLQQLFGLHPELYKAQVKYTIFDRFLQLETQDVALQQKNCAMNINAY
jgi:ribosomal protein L5